MMVVVVVVTTAVMVDVLVLKAGWVGGVVADDDGDGGGDGDGDGGDGHGDDGDDDVEYERSQDAQRVGWAVSAPTASTSWSQSQRNMNNGQEIGE